MGGCCLLEPGVELKGNKNSKIKLVVALDGSRQVKNMQQPTKNTRARRGRDRVRRATVGERRGGVHSIVFGRTSWERGVEYSKIDGFDKYFFFLDGLKN